MLQSNALLVEANLHQILRPSSTLLSLQKSAAHLSFARLFEALLALGSPFRVHLAKKRLNLGSVKAAV